ncbi:MAG: pseudouridine synthase [Christensenellales bacterium]|mgnify:CR=1 FL=1|jgi:16S rRNA pseudouridine516 synthase
MKETIRLDRLLSNTGLLTRKEAKIYARQGRINVNGETIFDSSTGVSVGDNISVDGEIIDSRLSRHIMLNKPLGYITASKDSNSPTVMDLLPSKYLALKCMPVGRLDKDTEGLLLFTTDGTLNHRLCSPKYGVKKCYHALVCGEVQDSTTEAFQKGIRLSDFTSKPASLEIISKDEGNTLCEVIITEGKYRQVRRMFLACGHEVLKLKRIAFGDVLLDSSLAPGTYRDLSDTELLSLYRSVNYE